MRMSLIERVLRAIVPHKEIGWKEINEEFTRFTLLKTPWFRIFLHKLNAPQWHPECHDHPWSFVAILLKSGYDEMLENGRIYHRRPGMILHRPAEFIHNVITPYGTSWSIIFAGSHNRDWGFHQCGEHK